MKRFFLIVLSCVITISLLAQKIVTEKNSNVQVLEKKEMEPVKKAIAEISEAADDGRTIKSKRDEDLLARYDRPNGVLLPSLIADDDSYGYVQAMASMFGAAYIPWVFNNLSTGADYYRWMWGIDEDGDDVFWSSQFEPEFYHTLTDGTPIGILPSQVHKAGGYIYFDRFWMYPKLIAGVGLVEQSYYPATSNSDIEGFIAAGGFFQAGTADYYGNTSDGGTWRVGMLNTGQHDPDDPENGWFFGTCARNNTALRASQTISYYKKPQTPMLVKDIAYLGGESEGIQAIANTNQLFLKVYKLNDLSPDSLENDWRLSLLYGEDGDDEIKNELIAESYIYGSDVISWVNTDGSTSICLKFPFKEIDPETGLEIEVTKVIEDAFAVVLFGIEQDENRFWVSCDYQNKIDRRSFIVYKDMANGKLERANDNHTQPSKYNAGPPEGSTVNNNLNMFLMLNAAFPYLHIDPGYETLEIDASGGKATDIDGDIGAIVYSEFDWNEGEDEYVLVEGVPSWLIVTKGSEYGVHANSNAEYLRYLTLDFEAPALPSGVTYREANIKLTSYKTEATIKVTQGESSIKEKNLENVSIYPNPFTNHINITNASLVKGIQIMNIAGQLVNNVDFQGNKVSTDNIVNGIYFVIIEGINGEKVVHKMVKK